MTSEKLPSVRQIGQLPLPQSFFHKTLKTSSTESNKQESQPTKPSHTNTRISLSDFLNRKLEKGTSKDRPSVASVAVGSGNENSGKKRRPEVDEKVFQQFKHPRLGKNQSDGGSEIEGSSAVEELGSRNRNPFRVSSSEKKCATSRHLLVIGDDPKPKSKRRGNAFVSHQKPVPLYNHYANGSGWWGCDREGIDSEEVGCSDAWEGMGATTNLGGLEWH